MPNLPKRILVFCDGTGQDGIVAKPENLRGGPNTNYATNVLRLSRAVKPFSADNSKSQIVFYQSGVGSESNFSGDDLPVISTGIQSTGSWVASKIRDAYAFIAQNFEVGDEIFLFGFSRGAYTARKVAGLIDKIGLLVTQDLGRFFTIWRQLVNGQKLRFSEPPRTTHIKCVGVWDTVGSVSGMIDALQIKDNSLPRSIDLALHALSLQENRKQFLPTLWTQPQRGIRSGQIVKQMWFPGSHSDVGGSFERHELADIALFWIAGEIKDIVNLDLDFLQRSRQPRPDPWGTTQPHNSYMTWWFGEENRLESGQIDRNSFFHQSILLTPKTPKQPKYMVTLPILQQEFGNSWVPKIPPLNPFEEKCKKEWGDKLRGPEPVFETIEDLFDGPANWLSGPILPGAIMGGIDSNHTALYVARANYQGGLYPGAASSQWMGVKIGYDGKEVIVENGNTLTGSRVYVRWVNVTGDYKLDGTAPINGGNEPDGTTIYIAQASIAGGTYCGSVKVGFQALIPCHGQVVTCATYRVLVFATPEYWESNMIMGLYQPISGKSAVKREEEFSHKISFPPMDNPPRVALGFSMLEMAIDKGHGNARVTTLADNIETDSFLLHITTSGSTALSNAAVAYLTMAPEDPNFQHDVFQYNDSQRSSATEAMGPTGNIDEWVTFAKEFTVQPRVFVSLTGFEMGGSWSLNVYATNIDTQGFKIHFDTAGDSSLLWARADWIAFPEDKDGVWTGTFSGNGNSLTGSESFGTTFSNTPRVLMALNQFDMNHEQHLQVRLDAPSITVSTMYWNIQTWGDGEVKAIGGAYLALEMNDPKDKEN